MSDVNFINNGGKGEEKDKKDKKEEEEKIDWSKVEKKEKKKENKKNIANSDDINTWLESLKEDSNVNNKGAKKLKNSKEALGEYQKVLQKNKKAAELKEGVDKVKGDGKIQEEKKGGIADIIKNKLSFGKDSKDESTIKTNLIKSEGVTYFDWKDKLKVLGINILLTLVILGTAYGYLEYRERGVNKKSTGISNEIDQLKSSINNLEKEAEIIDVFQGKVKIVSSLLDKHVYWTNFFDFLEKKLLTDVYLDSNFSGDDSGYFELETIGNKFSDLTDQSKVLRADEKVDNLLISTGEAVSGKDNKNQVVKFTINLEVSPSIFYK